MLKYRQNKARFSRETTAATVVADLDLSGKLAVITGGGSGLGKATALALAQAGAHVFIGGLDEQQLLNAKRDISVQAPHAHVSEHPLDLMSLASIAQFAQAVCSLDRAVDYLICSAGMMASPAAYSVYGFESQLMTNYVGHAALASLLSPLLQRAGYGARVISLTSSSHQLSPVLLDDLNFRSRPYNRWLAYGQSKTACALMAVHVQNQLQRFGVGAFAVHPGILDVELSHLLLTDEYNPIAQRLKSRVKSLDAGAATSVWAAVAPELNDQSSQYLEDCSIAPLLTSPNDMQFGVMPYALDPDMAARLWRFTEQALRQELPL